MFNRKSIYALNKKDPDAIVYMDANEVIIRLTCKDFASEEEFLKWKSWSDENYHTEDNQDVVEGKHNTSIDDLSEAAFSIPAIDVVMERQHEKAERRRVASAMVSQIRDKLTETQFRRLWIYYVGGITVDEVGEKEGVSRNAGVFLISIFHPSPPRTSGPFQTIDSSPVPVSGRYSGLPRRPRFGRQRGVHPVSCQYDTFGSHRIQSQWDASFHLHQNAPSPAHTAFQAPFIYPLSCEVPHGMYGVVILGIDTAQYRIGHSDSAAHAHIAISLSQPVHSHVDLLPSTPTPIVIKK